MDIKNKLFDLNLKGYCCSQMMVEMGMEKMDTKNPDLVAFSAGLCDGMYSDRTCGVLSAGLCLLYMVDPAEAALSLGRDLIDWFEDAFGSTECADLMGGNKLQGKIEICPNIIAATFEMVSEMLDWD